MGRSALVVKAPELQKVVSDLEATTTYSALSELCDAIAETPWAKNVRNEKHAIRGLSPQMAGIKIRELAITCKTQPGKRGRASGAKVNRTSKRDKAAKLKLGDYPSLLRKEVSGPDVPDRYKGLAEEALAGNAVAACKLQCGACMGYTGAEKACNGKFGGTPCPLYVINQMVFSKRRAFTPGEDGFWLLKALESEAS